MNCTNRRARAWHSQPLALAALTTVCLVAPAQHAWAQG